MRHAPLATLGLCLALLGAAGPARAAADLASVTFTVSVVRVENAVKSVTASIEVVGDRITRASITPPRGTLVEIPAGGAGFLLEQSFTTEAELTTAFPDGTYVLTLNGTTDYDLPLTRPPVPSPALSAPLPAAILVPGPVEVDFTPCSICDQDGDSTTGILLDGDGAEIENSGDTLGPNDERWTPATALAENASFTAVVMHTVVRADHLVGPGNDAFDLVGNFSQEDSVAFFTGGAVPTGRFCVVVDDDAADCPDGSSVFVVEHPADESGAVLDPSGTFATTVAGANVEYSADVLAGGDVTGSAAADLDGNGSFETVTPLRGRVSGSSGKVERSLRFAFESASPAAKLKVNIREDATVLDGALEGTQRARGTLLGAKVKEEQASEFPEADAPIGWVLAFELAGKQVSNASVRLANGRTVALTGRFLFDFLTDLGKLDLKSAGEDTNVSMRIEELSIDDSVDPPEITDGVLIYKILGQRGRFPRVR